MPCQNRDAGNDFPICKLSVSAGRLISGYKQQFEYKGVYMKSASVCCYIVRIYRRISNGDGDEDTVAGLVEKVGGGMEDKKITSYAELVDVLKNDQSVRLCSRSARRPVLPVNRCLHHRAGDSSQSRLFVRHLKP